MAEPYELDGGICGTVDGKNEALFGGHEEECHQATIRS